MAIAQDTILGQKFLSESLREFEPGITDTIYPEYWAYEGKYHTATPGLHFGAQEMLSARRDFTGKAARYGGRATTIPLANFGITMDKYKNMKFILGADWTWDELTTAEFASRNPQQPTFNIAETYREALERGLRAEMHYKTIFGYEEYEFTGLINNPYVEVIDVAAAANPFTGTGTPTAGDRYDWLLRETSAHKKASKLTGGSFSAVTSTDVLSSLKARFTDGSSDGTPLKLAKEEGSALLTDIMEANEFDGAEVRNPDVGNLTSISGVTLPGTAGGASAFDLMLFMENGEGSSVKRQYHPIETLPTFMLDDGMTTRLIGLCATSEVIYSQPFRARLYILRKV